MVQRSKKVPVQPAGIDPVTGTLTEIKGTPELCLLLGISAARLSQLTDEGVIPKAEQGRWDIFKVVPAYCAKMRSRKGERADRGTVNDSERRLAKAKADMAEQLRDQKAGTVLNAAAVARGWAGILSKARQQLLVLPTKLAPLVAVERETEPCRALIEQHVHEALKELETDGAIDGIADVAVGPRPDSTDDSAGDDGAEAASEADSESMGGSEPTLEFGGEFGTGALDDEPG